MAGATTQWGVWLDVAEAAVRFVPRQQGCGTRTFQLVPPRALAIPGVAGEEGGRGEGRPPDSPLQGERPASCPGQALRGVWVWVCVSECADVWGCASVGVCGVAVCRGVCGRVCVDACGVRGESVSCVFVRGGCICVCVRERERRYVYV